MQDPEETLHTWFWDDRAEDGPGADHARASRFEESAPLSQREFRRALLPTPLQLTLSWRGHILDLTTHHQPHLITCGTHPESTILLDETTSPFLDDGSLPWSLPLLCEKDGEWQLHLYSLWQAHFIHEDLCIRLQEVFAAHFEEQPSIMLSLAHLVEERGFFHIRLGHLDLYIERIKHAPRAHRVRPLDREPLPYLGLSTAIHVGLLSMLLTIPAGLDRWRGEDTLAEATQEPERFVQAIFLPPPPMAREPLREPLPEAEVPSIDPVEEHDLRGDGIDQFIGEQHREEEGRAGAPGLAHNAAMRVKRRPQHRRDRESIAGKRPEPSSLDAISKLGLLATLHRDDAEDGDFLGAARLTQGERHDDFLGKMRASRAEQSGGSFGLGLSGVGRGGGSKRGESIGITTEVAMTRIKMGGQGVALRAQRRGQIVEEILVAHDDATREKREMRVPGEESTAKKADKEAIGCLSQAMIQRAIRLRRSQLRACYEHELLKDRTLAGMLSVELHIAQDGKIDTIHVIEDTTRNEHIAACVRQKLFTLEFPTFDRCESVVARYPFHFHPKQLMVLP